MGNLTATFTYTQYTGQNTVKIAIYKDSDPDTEVTAQYQAGPFTNHIFYFAGLDRVAYKVKRYEVANDDHTHILADYGVFYVFTPGPNQKTEYKLPAEWFAGITLMPDGSTLYPSNVSIITNADWAGWEVEQFNNFGAIYMRGRDYSYDALSGTLTKLIEGDIFEDAAGYQLIFAPRISNVEGAPGPSGNDFSGKRYITADDSITTADAGKDIIVRGTASYIKINLPKLSEMQEGKRFYVRMPPGSTVRCARLIAQLSDRIDFGKGNRTSMFLYPSESFEFYKEVDDTDAVNPVSYIIIRNAQGNHLTVGDTVSNEGDASHVINLIEKDGGGASGLDADVFARLYEDFVLHLPSSQVVPYNQWGNGDNRFKFSLKDNTTNKFRIPDTRGQFERQSSAGRPCNSHGQNALKDHQHLMPMGSLSENGGIVPFGSSGIGLDGGQYYGRGRHKWDFTSKPYVLLTPGGMAQQEASEETRPDYVANNKYLRF